MQETLNSHLYACYICGDALQLASIATHIDQHHKESEILLEKFYKIDDIRATVKLSSIMEELKQREGYVTISSLISYFLRRNKVVVIDVQLPLEDETIFKNPFETAVTKTDINNSVNIDKIIDSPKFRKGNINDRSRAAKTSPKNRKKKKLHIELNQAEADDDERGQQELTKPDLDGYYLDTVSKVYVKEECFSDDAEELQSPPCSPNQTDLNVTEGLQDMSKTNDSNWHYDSTASDISFKAESLEYDHADEMQPLPGSSNQSSANAGEGTSTQDSGLAQLPKPVDLSRLDEDNENEGSTRDGTMSLQFISKNNGHRFALFDGYVYTREKENKGKTYWRCGKGNCKARIHAVNDLVIRPATEHTHPPTTKRIIKLGLTSEINRLCEDPDIPTSDIIDQVLATVSPAVKLHCPSKLEIKRLIRKRKQLLLE